MDKTYSIFTPDELKEIEMLAARGGAGASPLAQSICANKECVQVNPACTYRGCAIQESCTGTIDHGCTNEFCFYPIQSACAGTQTKCGI